MSKERSGGDGAGRVALPEPRGATQSGEGERGLHPQQLLETAFRRHADELRLWLRPRVSAEALEAVHSDVFEALRAELWTGQVPPEELADLRGRLLRLARDQRRNHQRDAIRRRRRAPEGEVDVDALPWSRPDPLAALVANERRALVHEVLADMPPRARDTFTQAALGERTAAEIAAQRGVPVPRVVSELRRARLLFTRLVKARAARWGLLAVLLLAGAARLGQRLRSTAPAAAQPAGDDAAMMIAPR